MENTTQKYTNARLMAIQATYAQAQTDEKWEKIVSRFLMGEVGGMVIKEGIAGRYEILPLENADMTLFTKLTKEVQSKEDDLDAIIRSNISPKIDYSRLELVLKCILKVGIAEFYANPRLDTPIIISEYVDITRSFFEESEAGIVNALLDKFAKIVR